MFLNFVVEKTTVDSQENKELKVAFSLQAQISRLKLFYFEHIMQILRSLENALMLGKKSKE